MSPTAYRLGGSLVTAYIWAYKHTSIWGSLCKAGYGDSQLGYEPSRKRLLSPMSLEVPGMRTPKGQRAKHILGVWGWGGGCSVYIQ